MRRLSEHTILRIFEIGLIIKACDGAFETIGGLLLLALPVHTLNSVIRVLTLHELSQDPQDFVATHLVRLAAALTIHAKLVASAYLLAHGIVKILLVISLLRSKLWAYPAAIVVLSIFVLYQLHRLILHPTWWLLALTLFDGVIIALTWHEYRLRTVHQP